MSCAPYDVEFVRVPAGEFVYGPEEVYERQQGTRPLRPQECLWLDEFEVATKPVRYGQWKQFLDETGYAWPGHWWAIRVGPRRHLRTYAIGERYPESMAEYPIVDVSQADALAYCDWLSGKLRRQVTLPTEQQWEKAARGTDGRTYPWGEELPRPELQWQRKFPVGPETYLFSLIVKPRREWARCGWYWRNGSPVPVGAIPQNVSPFGCLDMAGNIWEWTLSPYHPEDPRFHVVKGGSWGYSVHHTKCYVRSAGSIWIPSRDYRAQGTGFRVVVNL